jgi:hypothetical protein
MVTLGFELSDDDDWKNDVVLGEAADRGGIRK